MSLILERNYAVQLEHPAELDDLVDTKMRWSRAPEVWDVYLVQSSSTAELIRAGLDANRTYFIMQIDREAPIRPDCRVYIAGCQYDDDDALIGATLSVEQLKLAVTVFGLDDGHNATLLLP